MAKIIRTPTRAEGGITPEEKVAMDAIAQKWIGIAMRTDPIEPDKIVPAIHALYAAAGLKHPRVVIVPSPLVMAFAYGASAWIWYCRKNPVTDSATLSATASATASATDAATDFATASATYSATRSATASATRFATRFATEAATDAATDSATRSATLSATLSATYSATDAATRSATLSATRSATDAATYSASVEYDVARACFALAGKGGLECAKRWYYSYQGGNMWSAWTSYFEAMRDVLKLQLPEFEKYQAWEECALHGGFRVLHEEFCIVSDFPVEIHKDAENRPHNDNGPSHRWRDGWSLWYIHGVRVTEQIVMHPETLTVAQIDAEENAEVRRVMLERFGMSRYILESGAKPQHQDEFGVLYRRELANDEPIVMVRVLNSTPEPDGSLSMEEAMQVFGETKVKRQLTILGWNKPARFKEYWLRVPPDMQTAHEAVAWTFGKTAATYHPDLET